MWYVLDLRFQWNPFLFISIPSEIIGWRIKKDTRRDGTDNIKTFSHQ